MATELLCLLILCAVISASEAVLTPPLLPQLWTLSLDDLITLYFHLNLSYSLILAFLSVCHGFHISLSTLKRKLKQLRLHRRKWEIVDVQEAALRIQVELHGTLSVVFPVCNSIVLFTALVVISSRCLISAVS